MSSVFEALIDTCASAEGKYGFKVQRLAVDQGTYNNLRAELDWSRPYGIDPKTGVLIVNGVEVVVDA